MLFDINSNQRQAHVKRLFALDDSGSLNSDVWIDVLRIDGLPIEFRGYETGVFGQSAYYVFLWNDDPNNPQDGVDGSNADQQGENANAVRETEQLDVLNPDDPEDEDHVKLWIIDQLTITVNADAFSQKAGQNVQLVFNNTGPNDQQSSKRDVTVVKVVNNDLGGLKMSDDDGSNPVLVDWEQYVGALTSGQKDDGQHLDVEITDRFTQSFQTDEAAGGRLGQEITFALAANADVETLFDPGDPAAVDADGNPSVIRTDPLQAIVNVGFTTGLAVEFLDGAS